jgi:hypothetical protein
VNKLCSWRERDERAATLTIAPRVGHVSRVNSSQATITTIKRRCSAFRHHKSSLKQLWRHACGNALPTAIRDKSQETWGKAGWESCGKQNAFGNSFFVFIESEMEQKSPYEVRGTSSRGVRRSQKPLRALRSSGTGGGEAARLSCSSLELPRVLGSSRRAPQGSQKGAGTSCRKASELPRETQVLRGGRVHPGENGEQSSRSYRARSGRTHLGLR